MRNRSVPVIFGSPSYNFRNSTFSYNTQNTMVGTYYSFIIHAETLVGLRNAIYTEKHKENRISEKLYKILVVY
jgi:hypothetical protein